MEKKVVKKKAPIKPPVKVKYFEAIGRRKTATARVRISLGKGREMTINEKPLEKYFPGANLQQTAKSALETMNCSDEFNVSAMVKGGGICSQAEAVRHGISRALVLYKAEFRKRLKKTGYLTRDPRMRERKKFGLKRARRAPQWGKR